jgi:hypothetical protein
MAAVYPSGTNTYLPSFDATGNMIVSFSRNVKDFALNKYVTITPVTKSTGYYLRLTYEQAARVSNANLNDFVWADGNDAATGEFNKESFTFDSYKTERYAFPFRLGYKAVDQADWKIIAQHSAIIGQQAMTARTLQVYNKINTSTNWDLTTGAKQWFPNANEAMQGTGGLGLVTGQVSGASGLAGFARGTASNPVIKKFLNAAAIRINKKTLGVVGPRDLQWVMSPTVAQTLAVSEELQDYLKQSPFALSQVRGDSASQNGIYGLPDQLYGYNIVIEDAVRIGQKKNASASPDYIWGTTTALIARPGQLVGFEGAPSFSALHLMMYEEMTVEQRDDPDNRRITARVVEDYGTEVVAPVAAFIVQSSLADS